METKALIYMSLILLFVGFIWRESCEYNKITSRHDACIRALEKSEMTIEQFESCIGRE